MTFSYTALRDEYARLLAACVVTERLQALAAAKRILLLKPRYAEVSAKTGVPVLWLMVINERESGSNLFTYLGNGQSLRRVTTEVPAGRGPFASWEAGAEDALHLDHIDAVTDWCWPHALYEGEAWNGFGPRMHGRHTGYLWAGTNVYDSGKYVADRQWDAGAFDEQLGIVPLMRALVSLDASLDLTAAPASAPSTIPVPVPAPLPVPQGHDGGAHGVLWLQTALNALQGAALTIDGSYGRFTRMAVRTFQAAHGLTADGLAGPLTIAAIEAALASASPAGAPAGLILPSK
jgi:lysozyme family protein